MKVIKISNYSRSESLVHHIVDIRYYNERFGV